MGKDERCPACVFWIRSRDDDADRKGWNDDADDGDRNGDGTRRYGDGRGQKQTFATSIVPKRTKVQFKAEVKGSGRRHGDDDTVGRVRASSIEMGRVSVLVFLAS